MSGHLAFAVLGPVEVRLDGEPIKIGGGRQRALLALLLCHANRVVSRDQLIDELLGDQPPAATERMLWVQVSRLRKALAVDGAARLVAQPPGYVLRVDEDELDLATFERLVTDAETRLEHGDRRETVAAVRQAETLWRGRPLAELESARSAQPEIERLEELRLSAVEMRIDAELSLGRHAAVCSELVALVAEHPLRERLRAQLMLALYRSGRQAEALAQYRAARELLVGELGLEPTAQLRALERAILAHDRSVDLPALERPDAGDPPATLDDGRMPSARRPGVVRRALPAALGVLAAVVAAVLVVAPGSGTSARPVLRRNLLERLGSGGEQLAAVPLQAPAGDLVAGSGSLWVAEPTAGVVARVDPRRSRVVATIPAGTDPTRLLAAEGQIWVLDPRDETLSRIDPRTDSVAQSIGVAGDPIDLAASDDSIWVARRSASAVSRIDPQTGQTQSVTRVGAGPAALVAENGAVWVVSAGASTVERIDGRTSHVTAILRVGDAAADIAANGAAVWVLDPLDATLSRIDPRRDSVTTVPIPGARTGLATLNGSVWVTDRAGKTVWRVDGPRVAIANTIRIAARPIALAAADGLWVAVSASGLDHRGGTLTSVSEAASDSLDPAASTSQNAPPPQQFGLTNDGLVTLDHTGGVAGQCSVPKHLRPQSGRRPLQLSCP